MIGENIGIDNNKSFNSGDQRNGNFAKLDVEVVVGKNDEAHWRLRPDQVLFHTEIKKPIDQL